MARRRRDSFEVKLNDTEREDLLARLCQAIDDAQAARERIVGDDQAIDAWHKAYEGGDRKITKNTPWPGAANLHSWLGTEKVDSYRARIVKTIFTEPVWIVEGWGTSAQQVAFVEQFHQWKVEEERLQSRLSKVLHNGFIEGTGVLEVAEKPVPRRFRERMRVMAETNSFGEVVVDPETRQPRPLLQQGQPVPAMQDTPPEQTMIVTVDRVMKIRGGPQYRVHNLKNFVILPGHAAEKEDIWGYAKRFWKRIGELKVDEKLGIYQGIDELGSEDERQQTPEMRREGVTVEDQQGPAAEKELWEILFLADLEGKGIEEWFVATLHKDKRKLLRLQKDDIGQARYILWTPFPRPNSVYGYSLIGHKLETIIDEHTAWRNMIADRAHLAGVAPIKRTIGALWNPKVKPFGPNMVIDVRDQTEVQQLDIKDVPSSLLNREQMVINASERVTMSDTAAGVTPQGERTLGEVQMVTTSSMVRVEEVIKHLQEAMEELFMVRHEIWKRTLRQPEERLPEGLMARFEQRGVKLPHDMTPVQLLEGTFRGKPRASVESAEPQVQRQDFMQFMTGITQMAQAVPAFGVLFAQPQIAVSIMRQAMRLYRWEDRATMEEALQQVLSNPQMQQMMMGAQGQPQAPAQARTPNKKPVRRQGGEV